jgi:hypothetical protein
MLVLYLGALLLGALAVAFVVRGLHVWRSPDKHVSPQLTATGLDGSMIPLGITLVFGSLLDLGDAISVHGTRTNAGKVLFAIAGIAILPAAFLFVSVWFFNRPRFVVPPHLRSRPGALMSRNAHHRHKRR